MWAYLGNRRCERRLGPSCTTSRKCHFRCKPRMVDNYRRYKLRYLVGRKFNGCARLIKLCTQPTNTLKTWRICLGSKIHRSRIICDLSGTAFGATYSGHKPHFFSLVSSEHISPIPTTQCGCRFCWITWMVNWTVMGRVRWPLGSREWVGPTGASISIAATPVAFWRTTGKRLKLRRWLSYLQCWHHRCREPIA